MANTKGKNITRGRVTNVLLHVPDNLLRGAENGIKHIKVFL